MFPDQFDYHRATSVEEARSLLDEFGDEEVELLAGGHSLIPTMKSGLASPDVLIDISEIPALTGVRFESDAVLVGAATTYASFLQTDGVAEALPAFTEAVEHVGDRQVRNRGTVGGNLAHADPAADLPGAALVTDADIEVATSDGRETVPVDEFFLGMYTTAVGPGDILTQIEFPRVDGPVAGAYAKKQSPSSGYAMVGVAVRLELEDGAIARARVGASGVLDHGVRLEPVEDILEDAHLEEGLAEQAGAAALEGVDETMILSDEQASAEFRGALLETYTERATSSAIDRAAAVAPTVD